MVLQPASSCSEIWHGCHEDVLSSDFFFLLFPHVKRIQAFNRNGMDWTRMDESKSSYSEVGIAVDADGTTFVIYCLNNERQASPRSRVLAMDPSVRFFGTCAELRNLAAPRAQSYASAKAKKALEAEFKEVAGTDGKWRCLQPVHKNCHSLLEARSRWWHRQKYVAFLALALA